MPQLTSFAFFNKAVPVQVFDHPCDLVNLDGTVAAAGYLQIFDLAVAPSGGETPLKSFKVSAAGPLPSIFETLGPIHLVNGLAIAYSSTQITYTAVGTAFDIFGEVEQFEIDNTIGATVVGDTTTGVDNLLVWANGATTQGLHSLRKLEVANAESTNRWMMCFSHVPSAGDIPLFAIAVPYNTDTTVKYYFGTGGFVPFAKTAAGVLRDGCYLYISSTANVYTASISGGWTLKAWYV